MNTENRENSEHRYKVKMRSFLCTLQRLVRWFRHRMGHHNSICKAAGSWDLETGQQIRGHHCRVTGSATVPSDHLPPNKENQ